MAIHSLPGDVVGTVATPGTAVPLSTTDLFVRGLALWPKTATGGNTNTVFVGISTLDQPGHTILMWSIAAAQQVRVDVPIPPGGTINLKDVYVDALVAGEGVVGVYLT